MAHNGNPSTWGLRQEDCKLKTSQGYKHDPVTKGEKGAKERKGKEEQGKAGQGRAEEGRGGQRRAKEKKGGEERRRERRACILITYENILV